MNVVIKSFLKSSHKNEKPAFSNAYRLKSVFVKLAFRDGLVCTADLSVEIKLRFQISST